jgi:hypothetical protein
MLQGEKKMTPILCKKKKKNAKIYSTSLEKHELVAVRYVLVSKVTMLSERMLYFRFILLANNLTELSLATL